MQWNETRPVEVLDCTIRDGGYINQWKFTLEFGIELYRALSRAGVHWMEIGFLFPDGSSRSPWSNCDAPLATTLREAVPDGCGLAAMVNYGSGNLPGIPDRDELGIDLIRIAVHQARKHEAVAFARHLREQRGYRVSVNFMGISNYTSAQLEELAALVGESREVIDYAYLADSFGSLLPTDTARLFDRIGGGTQGLRLGFHPHNNLQMAFANSLEALQHGAGIIDGSILGIGRGAGNLHLEVLLRYLETLSPKSFRSLPVLNFAELFMEPLRARYSWGFSLPQMISGSMRCHPSYPTGLLRLKSYTVEDVYEMLDSLPAGHRSRFSEERLNQLVSEWAARRRKRTSLAVSGGLKALLERSSRRALVVCGGASAAEYRRELEAYAIRENRAVISVNRPDPPIASQACFFGNSRRWLQFKTDLADDQELILSPLLGGIDGHSNVTLSSYGDDFGSRFVRGTPILSGCDAVSTLFTIGFEDISIAGMDGFADRTHHYYDQPDQVRNQRDFLQLNRTTEEELSIIRDYFEPKGHRFRIITPTLFTRFAEPAITPGDCEAD